MRWKTVPLRVKAGVEEHDTLKDAEERAQRVANKTGDWCVVETVGGDVQRLVYFYPMTARRKP